MSLCEEVLRESVFCCHADILRTILGQRQRANISTNGALPAGVEHLQVHHLTRITFTSVTLVMVLMPIVYAQFIGLEGQPGQTELSSADRLNRLKKKHGDVASQ